MSDDSEQKKTITLTVEAELTLDRNIEGGKLGSLRFGFADCTVNVTDDETGEDYGQVKGTLGGGTELHDHKRLVGFYISPQTLWYAFQAALEEQGEQPERMTEYMEARIELRDSIAEVKAQWAQ